MSNVKLFLIGRDRGSKKKLSKLVKDLNIRKKVLFISNINNIPIFLSAMDGFVFYSLSESFPNAVLEALFSKLPIVSTRVGGIPEMLKSKTGILVNEKNLNLKKKYDINLMVEKHIRLYEKEYNNLCAE